MSEATQLVEQLMALIRTAGPAVFFVAMLVLPAAGVPMLAFLLPAVSLFASELGLLAVLVLALACVTANMALTFAVARRGLRPLLTRMVTRFGYRLPQVKEGEVTDLIVLLRVTPGLPFCVQNYLAGLAQAPFGKYMLVSCVVVWPLNIAFMLFGDSLLQGNGKVALLMFGLLAVFAAARLVLRRHYAARKSQA